MIYITGDTHGKKDAGKLETEAFREQEALSRSDYLIIAGDFGFIWKGDEVQRFWLEWFAGKRFTTLFIDGNHENFQLLHAFPVEEWMGGLVHRIGENVIHLMRGQVFMIDGLSFFTFGGARSEDRRWRTPGLSWWPEEMPSAAEYETGLVNLERKGFKVDYIVSHTAPSSILERINEKRRFPMEKDELTDYLERLRGLVSYRKWYFGHFHIDHAFDDASITGIYKRIEALGG